MVSMVLLCFTTSAASIIVCMFDSVAPRHRKHTYFHHSRCLQWAGRGSLGRGGADRQMNGWVDRHVWLTVRASTIFLGLVKVYQVFMREFMLCLLAAASVA